MKEHPIIFNTEMVKAILEGRKTQTRRVIKGKRASLYFRNELKDYLVEDYPYGQIGDRLWVKETFNVIETIISPQPRPDRIIYKASPETYQGYHGIHWQPSIFMPKKYARIWLEIMSVRVERLQEMSYEDAKAEGFRYYIDEFQPGCSYLVEARERFGDYWDSFNAKKGYAWETNPWVWAIDFVLHQPMPVER